VDNLEQRAGMNFVLRDIAREELATLLPHMQTREVEAREVLHQAGEPIRYVYLPLSALMSMLMPTSDGATVELATVGREGLTGISALLDESSAREQGALAKVVTVVPGTVIRMKSDLLRNAMETHLTVARSIRRYLSQLVTDLALSVTCNRLHSLEQRCAKWLLTAMDKSGTSDIPVTQELLAGILGVYRQSVVQVVSDFEAAGLIRGGRGSIRLVSRERLTTMVCECYQISVKRGVRT